MEWGPPYGWPWRPPPELRAVILLVDTPGIGAPAVRAVLAADSPVVVATYRGRRGHPVVVDRSWWAEVAERAEGDRGARPFFAAHPELVREVECAGDPFDLDTLGIWQRGGTILPRRDLRRRPDLGKANLTFDGEETRWASGRHYCSG